MDGSGDDSGVVLLRIAYARQLTTSELMDAGSTPAQRNICKTFAGADDEDWSCGAI